jgi:hypothetical protein
LSAKAHFTPNDSLTNHSLGGIVRGFHLLLSVMPQEVEDPGPKASGKVLLFGEFITGTIAFPVPHLQYVFSLPIMLRV